LTKRAQIYQILIKVLNSEIYGERVMRVV